jgi:transcriptional regulatory protein LevR
MELDKRLNILISGDVVTEDIGWTMRRVIERFNSRWRIELNEENGGRMITHLAMALMRIQQQEEVNPMEEEHFDEFKSSEYFALALEMTDDICGWTPLDLPESERRYLDIYICLLLDELNES